MTRSGGVLIVGGFICAGACSTFGSDPPGAEPATDASADAFDAGDAGTEGGSPPGDSGPKRFCDSRPVGCWDFEEAIVRAGWDGANLTDGGYIDLDDQIVPAPGHSARLGLPAGHPVCDYAELRKIMTGPFTEARFDFLLRLGDANGNFTGTPAHLSSFGVNGTDPTLIIYVAFGTEGASILEQYLPTDGGPDAENIQHAFAIQPPSKWLTVKSTINFSTSDYKLEIEGGVVTEFKLAHAFANAPSVTLGVGFACTPFGVGAAEARFDNVLFEGK